MSSRQSLDYLMLFKHRFEHCQILVNLSQQQQQAIEQGALDELLSILGRKQRVLTLMEESKTEHPALWECWQSERDQLPGENRERCENLLAETEKTLATLIEYEKLGTEQLERNRDETKLKLEEISRSVQANSAYRDQSAGRTHRFLDVGR